MRFIILTQYYPPETGAPQNRLQSLAKHLAKSGHNVSVITAMPNYPKMKVYEGYRNHLFISEMIDNIAVFRSWIFVSKSKAIIPRLINYFSFVLTSLFAAIKAPSCDYVICESPPLFLGIAAYIIKKCKRAKLIFNVSDLWPESAEKLGLVNNRHLLNASYSLEKFLYKQAILVTGQTRGIVDNISFRFPNVPVHWLPNGIDEEVYSEIKIHPNWRDVFGIGNRKVFLYAGIIGHAQGLEIIIHAAASYKNDTEFVFVMVGDGPVKNELVMLNSKLQAGVIFIPNTAKVEVMQMVADSYAYVVPLKKLDLFLGAIPSKVFDPLALGIPILLGVDGEARSLFIDQGNSGLYFEPENTEELIAAVNKLGTDEEMKNRLGENGRRYVNQYFNRAHIAQSFLDKI